MLRIDGLLDAGTAAFAVQTSLSSKVAILSRIKVLLLSFSGFCMLFSSSSSSSDDDIQRTLDSLRFDEPNAVVLLMVCLEAVDLVVPDG